MSPVSENIGCTHIFARVPGGGGVKLHWGRTAPLSRAYLSVS